MSPDVLANKIESLRRCIARIEQKRPSSADDLRKSADLQDIMVINLERAVQVCVDIAAHLISSRGGAVPGTMAEAFSALATANVITPATAERMQKAVGFRNIAVHEYEKINWDIVFKIVTIHLEDFRQFAREVLKAPGT